MAREPTVGDTFAVPWKKGAFGLCRVVWTQREWRHTSVVCLEWFGAAPPELAVARSARLLELTHPGYSGVCWVRILKGQHIPDGYVELGRFEPTPEERALPLGDVWEDPLHLR